VEEDSPIVWEPTSVPEQPPRLVKTKPNILAWEWVLSIGFLLIVLGGLLIGYRAVQTMEALRIHGRIYEGKVVQKWFEGGRSQSYHIRYGFVVNDEDFEGSTVVSQLLYGSLSDGGPVSVTALPNHLETHVVGAVDSARVDGVRFRCILATGVLAGIILAFLVGMLCFLTSQRRVLATYVACPGWIESVAEKGQGKDVNRSVTYRYRDPKGRTQTQMDFIDSSIATKLETGQATTVMESPDGFQVRLFVTLTMVEPG
jgi:hypothetical protein